MRTEEDKVLQTPIKVKFGDKEYEIKLLVVTENRKWKKQVSDEVVALGKQAVTDIKDNLLEENPIALLLCKMPDKAIDLLFSYAKNLKREEIEPTATDEQFAVALDLISEVAFPLAKSLAAMMSKLSR